MNIQTATTTRRASGLNGRGLDVLRPFYGLSEGVGPYDIVRLLRDVGHHLGLTGSDVQHIDYLVSHTREIDWTPSSRPIVYKSVGKMARERGVSERQIRHRETKLYNLGLIGWNDLGNYRRFGWRDSDGRIETAYGVDLSPLADRYEHLVELKRRQIADLAAFDKARKTLSSIRRRILLKRAEAQERGIESAAIGAVLPSVRSGTPGARLDAIIAEARMIEADLDAALRSKEPRPAPGTAPESPPCAPASRCELSVNTSAQADKNFRHIQPTNNPQSVKTDTGNPPGDKDDRNEEVTSGAEHVSLRMAVEAAGDRFIEAIYPAGRGVSAADLVDAAARLCPHLGISRSAWVSACTVMGRYGATVAVIVIDRNMDHPETPIASPGGVLRAMTARAENGDLHLHKSVFGILERTRSEGGAS